MKSEDLNVVAQIATNFLSFLSSRRKAKKKRKTQNIVRK